MYLCGNRTKNAKTMNIYNLIILDESGSMCSIEHQAVSSMNETIQIVKAIQKNHPEQKQSITALDKAADMDDLSSL